MDIVDSEPSFKFRNGELFCEEINIQQFVETFPTSRTEVRVGDANVSLDVPPTPFFLHSLAALKSNVSQYCEAITNSGLRCRLGYAVKANGNHYVLKALKDAGVEMLVTVSGNEILAGIQAGFQPQNIIFNGNGKQEWEIKLAIQLSTVLNVDSIFDAQNISNVLRTLYSGREVRVLLRIRPGSKVHKDGIPIHPYVNTAEASKFGFGVDELDAVLEIIRENGQIKVYGIHCHLGSCIQDPNVYHCIGTIMNELVEELSKRGHNIELLDIGGGIGIDYHKPLMGMEEYMQDNKLSKNMSQSKSYTTPTVASFMKVIAGILPKTINIVLEPGRSLVANTGIVVCKVLGTKSAGSKQFAIVDASMAEVIRPCLYNAYHQVVSTKLYKDEPWQNYDVVGPICETADFLGHEILLQNIQNPSTYLAIMDTGAYCSSMSSNYNMRPRPVEIMVDGTSWSCMRERDTFEDLTRKTNII